MKSTSEGASDGGCVKAGMFRAFWQRVSEHERPANESSGERGQNECEEPGTKVERQLDRAHTCTRLAVTSLHGHTHVRAVPLALPHRRVRRLSAARLELEQVLPKLGFRRPLVFVDVCFTSLEALCAFVVLGSWWDAGRVEVDAQGGRVGRRRRKQATVLERHGGLERCRVELEHL